jgi:nucleotidyltransferase substrate binding protein (TIGR01987 family)
LRWKERFQNFEKTFLYFEKAVEQETYNELEVGGLIQAFEFSFEMGWKTVKDFLNEQGIKAEFPRDTIKTGYKNKIILDGHLWIKMLNNRNDFSHDYNREFVSNIAEQIRNVYYPAIDQVYQYFKEHINE